MIYIKNNSIEPYFNLAAEEYLLKNIDGDIFMLWQNDKSVIIGKNQNAYTEINIDYVKKNNIKIVRRLTGGGCVFHDLGNINYTFICDSEKSKILNFSYFMQPVISALESLGIKAQFTGRNDICFGEYKISGNAQCVYNANINGIKKERILHHGTLLFSANLNELAGSLNVDKEKIQSKGIKSVSSRVKNINEFLSENKKMSPLEFINYLEEFITKIYNCDIYNLSEKDIIDIKKSADEKYCTDEFIYGSFNEYEFSNKKYLKSGLVEIRFNVKDKKIDELKINGDFFGKKEIVEFEKKFNGILHEKNILCEFIGSLDIEEYISGIDKNEFIDLFF